MINVLQKIVLILKWPIGRSNYLRFNYPLSEIRSLVSYFIICIDSPTKHLKDQFNKPVIWVEHPPLKFSAGAIPYFPWEDRDHVFGSSLDPVDKTQFGATSSIWILSAGELLHKSSSGESGKYC